MEKIRLFIALPLTCEVRRKLRVITASLSERISGVRWSRAENIHLTLKFLGDVKTKKVGEIKRLLKEVAGRHTSLDISVGEL